MSYNFGTVVGDQSQTEVGDKRETRDRKYNAIE